MIPASRKIGEKWGTHVLGRRAGSFLLGCRVGNQTELQAAPEKFGIANVLAGADGAALPQDEIDVHAAEAAEIAIGVAHVLAQRMSAASQGAQVAFSAAGHFSDASGRNQRVRVCHARRETQGACAW